MAGPQVVYFSDPDKGRRRIKITNRDKKRLRQGDVTELFASPISYDSNNTTATTYTKTWSKSDLTTAVREISALADTLTKQTEAEKAQKTKSHLRERQRCSIKSYPEVQKEKKEKELRRKEEQWINGTSGIINKKGKQNDKRRQVARGRGRWKDNIKALDPPVGKFKNGMLSLSQNEVKKISKS